MMFTFTHHKYLQDEEIMDLFRWVQDDKLEHILFYSGGIKTAEDWLAFIKKDCWLVSITDKYGDCVAFFWLNGFMGRTAQFHFTFFRDTADLSIDIGKQTLKWLAKLGKFDSVFGVTPKPFRHAWKYCQQLGFELMGSEVPGACFMQKYDRHVPGIISVMNLNELKENNNGRRENHTGSAGST